MPKKQDYSLRKIQETDFEKLLTWRNSERIRSNMYTDHIISVDEHRSWITNVLTNNIGSIYRIFELNGDSIGLASASQIDQRNHKCCWAFYLGETEVPPGSGAAMEFIFLEHLFEHVEMRKVYCEVFDFNKTTIKLHKKFGFQEEGHFKKHILKEDIYESVTRMALFKDEWFALKAKLGKLCFRQG